MCNGCFHHGTTVSVHMHKLSFSFEFFLLCFSVVDEWHKSLQACVQADGGHLEKLIKLSISIWP